MEWQLFAPGTVPAWTTPEWYADRDRAPHLEQATHEPRLKKAGQLVTNAAVRLSLSSVVDLGAGDGGLLSLLSDSRLTCWGYDLQPSNLAGAAERRVDVRYGDVVNGEIEWGQIAVATEMLEHLVDPHGFVRRIGSHCDVLVASSPGWERGGQAYVYHTWAWDYEGYCALLEQGGFKVIAHEDAGGFQVAMGVRR